MSTAQCSQHGHAALMRWCALQCENMLAADENVPLGVAGAARSGTVSPSSGLRFHVLLAGGRQHRTKNQAPQNRALAKLQLLSF